MENNYKPQLNYAQIQMMNDVAKQQVDKLEKFKNRLKSFDEVKTIEEAKELAKKIMPVSQEVSHFRIGGAKCVVVNKDDMFRVSVDTDDEFISYDFS